MIDESIFENKNQKLKKENTNQFYIYEKTSKRRKRKYMEYLECEFGYKIDRKEGRMNK